MLCRVSLKLIANHVTQFELSLLHYIDKNFKWFYSTVDQNKRAHTFINDKKKMYIYCNEVAYRLRVTQYVSIFELCIDMSVLFVFIVRFRYLLIIIPEYFDINMQINFHLKNFILRNAVFRDNLLPNNVLLKNMIYNFVQSNRNILIHI